MVTMEVPFYSQRIGSDWKSKGYPNRWAAKYWESRACGIACVRMIVEGLAGVVPPNEYSIISSLGWRGGYIPGKGWVHRSLIEYAGRYGITGEWHRAETREQILELFRDSAEQLGIASVSVGLTPGVRGGHLVVIIDVSERGLVIHHPSSDETYEMENWFVPWNRFMDSYAQAIMIFRGSGLS